jgi:hypothetical protein
VSTATATFSDVARSRKKPVEPSPTQHETKAARQGRALNIWLDEKIGQTLDDFVKAQRFTTTITSVVELALQEFFDREHFPPKH